MRTCARLLARLLALALPALVFPRPATGQTCELLTPLEVTVTAQGVLTPVSFYATASSEFCLYTIACDAPIGSLFPVGTTIVTCTMTYGFDPPKTSTKVIPINVVPPTDASYTATEEPFANPVPGSTRATGASFGRTDVFYSSTGQFNVYDEGAFLFSFSAQSFVAYNCAPIDDGVSCIGAKDNQLTIAQIGFCGDTQASLNFTTVPDQSFNLSAGIFFSGWGHGHVCAGTPADGKAFEFVTGVRDDPFTFATMPQGSRMQDLFPFGQGCAALGTGQNGLFFYSRFAAPSFVPLGYTPDSGTTRSTGNLFVTSAAPKLFEHDRSGQEIASYDLPNRIFRTSTYYPDHISGYSAPTFGFAWNPSFKKGILHKIFGDGNTVVDLKAAPGDATIFFLRDPIAQQTFPRRVNYKFEDRLSWTKGAHRIRFGGDSCHPTVAGR